MNAIETGKYDPSLALAFWLARLFAMIGGICGHLRARRERRAGEADAQFAPIGIG